MSKHHENFFKKLKQGAEKLVKDGLILAKDGPLAPLLPFMPMMLKQLKKEGVEVKNKIDIGEVAQKFITHIVRKPRPKK